MTDRSMYRSLTQRQRDVRTALVWAGLAPSHARRIVLKKQDEIETTDESAYEIAERLVPGRRRK